MSTEKKEETPGDILFSNWDSPEDVDFFGEKPTEPEPVVADKVEPIETPEGGGRTPEEVDKDKKDKEEKESQEDFTFFENSETDPEVVVEDPTSEATPEAPEKTPEAKPKELTSLDTLKFLKERGLAEYELDEGTELTEAMAEDILEDSFEASVDAKLSEMMSELPSQVKELVKYAAKGGDVDSLLSDLAQASATGITADTDITNEANQIKILTLDLQAKGTDPEEIQAQIEYFKDSGKLESLATKAKDRIVAQQGELAQQAAAQQAQARAEVQQRQREYQRTLADKLKETKEIKGFKFTPKEKRELASYIAKPTEKLTNGSVVSGLQLDLHKALQDADKTVLIAKILRSDFDMSSFKKAAESSSTKKIKENLQNTESVRPSGKKSVLDYF